MNIIEGIGKEIRGLITKRSEIEDKIKALVKARDVLDPVIARGSALDILDGRSQSEPKTGKCVGPDLDSQKSDAEKSPRSFLKKEFMGMSVTDCCREVVPQFHDSFRERDISRLIFSYRSGMDANRCHSACAAALISFVFSGECVRVSPGNYRATKALNLK
jgi:hypothetical protein